MSRWARGPGRHWLFVAGGVFACGDRPPVAPERIIPGVTVGAPCDGGRCQDGMRCGYEPDPQKGKDRCVLDPGRCRDDWDCARSVQRCRRFGTHLGVCQDSGL
jgi:hypothetical protein